MNRPNFPIALARALAKVPEAWAPGVLRLRAAPPGFTATDGTPAEECRDWLRPEGVVNSRPLDPFGCEESAIEGAHGFAVPDLENPATVGSLVGVYRELTGNRVAFYSWDDVPVVRQRHVECILITDGEPPDGRAVARAILKAKGIAVGGGE